MRRSTPILYAVTVLGVGAAAWFQLAADGPARSAGPPRPMTFAARQLSEGLKAARRQCSMKALDAVIHNAGECSDAAPDDDGVWRVLAEAHLERAQQRIHLRGLNVGQPFFTQLPADFEGDLDTGLAAVAQAQLHGDDSSSIFTTKALLMSHRITSVMTALRYNGAIDRALTAAERRDGDAVELQIALGLRKLLSPELFGHDAAGALAHFQRAATDGDDERASIYASMVCNLQGQRELALEWLERAASINPANVFAKVMLARLRDNEGDPFSRDISDAEAAAATSR